MVLLLLPYCMYLALLALELSVKLAITLLYSDERLVVHGFSVGLDKRVLLPSVIIVV